MWFFLTVKQKSLTLFRRHIMIILETNWEIRISHLLPIFVVKHVENLWDWWNGKWKSMPFAIPLVWREGKDHIMDCYFCMINLKEINRKNKNHVQYPAVPSVIKPTSYSPDLPVSESDCNMKYNSDSEQWHDCCSRGWHIQTRRGWPASALDTSKTQEPDTRPEPFKGVCSAAGFMCLLALGTTFCWYWDSERELRQFFHISG